MPSGQTKLMKETGISFVLGLLASMVFMYLILAAQFESWLHPVTILLSLPLTLPFAILSVVLFKQALDIYSFLGIFVLFGVGIWASTWAISRSGRSRTARYTFAISTACERRPTCSATTG